MFATCAEKSVCGCLFLLLTFTSCTDCHRPWFLVSSPIIGRFGSKPIITRMFLNSVRIFRRGLYILHKLRHYIPRLDTLLEKISLQLSDSTSCVAGLELTNISVLLQHQSQTRNRLNQPLVFLSQTSERRERGSYLSEERWREVARVEKEEERAQ